MSDQQFASNTRCNEKQSTAKTQNKSIRTETRIGSVSISVNGTFCEKATRDEKSIIFELILRHINDFELDNASNKSEYVALTKEV